jgi:hypothetical protein
MVCLSPETFVSTHSLSLSLSLSHPPSPHPARKYSRHVLYPVRETRTCVG